MGRGDLNVWKVVSIQNLIHLMCLNGAKSIKNAYLCPFARATLHSRYALTFCTQWVPKILFKAQFGHTLKNAGVNRLATLGDLHTHCYSEGIQRP